jgi:hypothetical protein
MFTIVLCLKVLKLSPVDNNYTSYKRHITFLGNPRRVIAREFCNDNNGFVMTIMALFNLLRLIFHHH